MVRKFRVGSASRFGHANRYWPAEGVFDGYITEQEYNEWTALATRALRATSGWLTYLKSCSPEGPGSKRPFNRAPHTNREPDEET